MFHLNTLKIKHAANSKGIGAADLAKRAELPKEFIEDIFNGRSAKLISFKPIALLATALNLKPADLIHSQIAF